MYLNKPLITALTGSAILLGALGLMFMPDAKEHRPADQAYPGRPSTQNLSAPAVMVVGDSVYVIMGDRECNKTYNLYRSYDGNTWEKATTVSFSEYSQPHDPQYKDCPNDIADIGATISPSGQKIFYRYALVDADGNEMRQSDIGEATAE